MKNPFARKATPVWNIIVQGKEGSPVWTKFSPEKAAQTYTNIDTVFSCVDIIASGVAQAGFKVEKRAKNGDIEDLLNHPVLDLLANPEPTSSQSALLYAYSAWKLISGNSYLVFNTGDGDDNLGKAPVEINTLRADRMKLIPSATGVLAYRYTANGTDRDFMVDQTSGMSNVLHSKTFNPTDDFYGLSPMQAGAKNIDIYSDSLIWNRSILQNAGRLSGMLQWKGEGDPSAEQIAQIKKEFDSSHKGADKAGGIMFGNKLDFKEMSLTPKDMEFIQGKNMTMKDIARVYKVPPILLNIGSDATFSNMAEARLALYDDAVIPLLNCFVNEMNYSLMPRYGKDESIKLMLDLNAVTALEPRRESQWKRAKEADFLTVNERRAIVDYPSVDDGDDVLINASQVPLAFASPDLSGDDQKKN